MENGVEVKNSFKLFLAAAFVVTEFFIVSLPLMITYAKADGHPIQAITHAGFGLSLIHI